MSCVLSPKVSFKCFIDVSDDKSKDEKVNNNKVVMVLEKHYPRPGEGDKHFRDEAFDIDSNKPKSQKPPEQNIC